MTVVTVLTLVFAFDCHMTQTLGHWLTGQAPTHIERQDSHGCTLTWDGDQLLLRNWCDYLGADRCTFRLEPVA